MSAGEAGITLGTWRAQPYGPSACLFGSCACLKGRYWICSSCPLCRAHYSRGPWAPGPEHQLHPQSIRPAHEQSRPFSLRCSSRQTQPNPWDTVGQAILNSCAMSPNAAIETLLCDSLNGEMTICFCFVLPRAGETGQKQQTHCTRNLTLRNTSFGPTSCCMNLLILQDCFFKIQITEQDAQQRERGDEEEEKTPGSCNVINSNTRPSWLVFAF